MTENLEEKNDTFLYTGRTFRIREARENDLPTWYKWFNDPNITAYMMHGVVPNTLEKQREFLLTHSNGDSKVMFSIVASDSPLLIGTCSINVCGHWLSGHAEISLVIGNPQYHKGPLYLEITSWQLDHAFLMMNMHSVFAATDSKNQPVIKTLEYLNFKKMGVSRESSYKHGIYNSSVWFDILKDEWIAFKGGQK